MNNTSNVQFCEHELLEFCVIRPRPKPVVYGYLSFTVKKNSGEPEQMPYIYIEARMVIFTQVCVQ